MKRLLLGAVLLTAACGGGSTTTGPSPVEHGILAGTWPGVIVVNGVSTPTTWTFQDMPNTAGHGYNTTVNTALVASLSLLNASLTGADFHAGGTYTSANGCSGVINAFGSGDAKRIDATFSAQSACDGVNGHLILLR